MTGRLRLGFASRRRVSVRGQPDGARAHVLAIPLAALGFLNPLVAAATMTLSSVSVVWNSLRRFAARPR